MRISLLFVLVLILILHGDQAFSVSGQCQPDQRALLLQLNNSLEFETAYSTKLVYWNRSADCCSWQGVSCSDGRVTGLDLSNEWIKDGIIGSSRLFQLRYLQSLNLAYNRINLTAIPAELGKLTNLSYLNLSNAGFAGQIPGSISSLRRLVVLDLSTLSFGAGPLVLENPNLRTFVQNFKELTQLHLDGVTISAQGKEWSQALSSSLPKLRVLSLSYCNVSGPIDRSLLKLSRLSEIHLDNNNLSRTIPEFFGNFSNLTSLSLRSSSLSGQIPVGIFQLSTLQIVDFSYNELLQASFPDFPLNGSLRTLTLTQTNVSGKIPDSIGNLKMLSRIQLSNCSLRGQIPSSISGLKELVHLDLSSNYLTGAIPSFVESRKLAEVVLSYNNLTGQLPVQWKGLQRLENLDLRYNQLNGTIPSSLLALPNLKKLQLSNNLLSGKLNFSNESSSFLETLDLSSNRLDGEIPGTVFELRYLKFLSLSYNNLSGPLDLRVAQQLKNLSTMDLSFNRLSVSATVPVSSSLSLSTLKLASCKLMVIPEFLRGQTRLVYLDLSGNQIEGEIPNWLLKLESLQYLNISGNHLVSIKEPSLIPSLTLNVIDVHKNHLQGQIPHIAKSAAYLDFSDNNFSSTIPENLGEVLSYGYYFSVSGNKLNGSIPASICDATYLLVLDLSNNSLSGVIPECLTTMTGKLGVLNLRRNNFGGIIPDTFPESCKLQTLDLNGNSFKGKVPKTLAHCTDLEVVNLGNNLINDSFPCQLKPISRLRVLVLRSNQFFGVIGCENPGTWPMLQIVDLASNNFSGSLPGEKLRNWKAMMSSEDEQPHNKHLQFAVLELSRIYYQDTITITSKGLEMELVKIITVFTSIDLSCNNLEGPIPDVVGKFNALYVLNLSQNALSGPIPESLGNVSQLESLDLSSNKLKGRIPTGLANLNFLSYLNLSNNKLEGSIPTSTQLQSFSEQSFENNEGLCGPPLKIKCSRSEPPTGPRKRRAKSENGFNWQFILTGLGFGVGAAAVVAPATFCERIRRRLNHSVEKILQKAFTPVVFIYTSSDNAKVEVEENNSDESENDDDGEGNGGKFRDRYCVFCSKLDMSMKLAIHDPKCTCHDFSTVSSSSSAPSS